MSRGRTACSRKPFSGHVGTTSITVRVRLASLERRETPDPWRSDAVKAGIQCVRRAAGSRDPVRPAGGGKCGELGFGMGVTHWHAGRNCAADFVRRSQGCADREGLSQVHYGGMPADGRAGMRRGGIAGFATQRGRSGRDPGAPGPGSIERRITAFPTFLNIWSSPGNTTSIPLYRTVVHVQNGARRQLRALSVSRRRRTDRVRRGWP